MADETKGGLIYQAIPKIMKEVGAITKSRKNAQQNYQFRGIDDIYNACQPEMIKQGVFVVPEVLTDAREERQTKNGGNLIYTVLKVKHTFFASDGSNIIATTIGEAMDSGDKSANKAMSAAMKYALIETFSIPTQEDNDTENHTHEVAPKRVNGTKPAKPIAPAVQQLAEYGDIIDDEIFRDAFGAELRKRGFDDPGEARVLAAMCKKDGVKSINDLPIERRHAFVAGIKSGQLDKFKEAPKQQRATVGAGK